MQSTTERKEDNAQASEKGVKGFKITNSYKPDEERQVTALRALVSYREGES